MTARKTTRKKATRKKATARKATRKKTTRKKTTRKKATRKKATRKARSIAGVKLPASLAAFRRELHRDLNALERKVASARKDARRRLTRVVRQASHQLGQLEARGAGEWRKLSAKARKDAENTLRRVRGAAGRA